ncbi:MAG TPA: ABC transporter permease [Opitutaceae bacterium]|nr:ABC transporter permease [Opitutaceae bacterium]
MNLKHIAVVYRKELRDLLRDRRTVRSMIILPVVLMPLMLVGLGKVERTVDARARAEIPLVQVVGGTDSPGILARLQEDSKIRVEPATTDWRQLIADKKIRAAVEISDHFENGLQDGTGAKVTIYEYQGELRSGFAAGELEAFFRRLSFETARQRLADRGLTPAMLQPFTTQRENVAPPEKVAGNRIGGFVPYFIVILCFTGAMYPALDLTAGEKERGTMEPLLCCPLARTEIVLGKFLMILTSSLSAVALACLSLAACIRLGGFDNRAASLGLAHVDPFGAAGVLVLILPVAVLFSSVMLTLGLWARSFREAQSYLQPMMFVIILPAIIGMMPGIELNARLALVPILNVSLASREMLSGVWHWPELRLILFSLIAYAAAALSIAVRMFNREAVIFRT